MEFDPKIIGVITAVEKPQTEVKTESRTHTLKVSATYGPIVRGLSSFFNRGFISQSRTFVADEGNKIGAIMAYSKMYPQGNLRKYWFAIHPKKLEQCTTEKGYYIVACCDNNIAVAVPMDFLKERLECLNVSNQNVAGRKYYYMVLFVDGAKVSWLLSKPEVQEIDISRFGFHI